MKDTRNLYRFCTIALLEGISFLLLLLVAMPLKYIGGWPEPVRYVGWAHGLLFIAYVLWLLICTVQYQWSLKRSVGFFIASLLPIVPFIIEVRLKREARAADAAKA